MIEKPAASEISWIDKTITAAGNFTNNKFVSLNSNIVSTVLSWEESYQIEKDMFEDTTMLKSAKFTQSVGMYCISVPGT